MQKSKNAKTQNKTDEQNSDQILKEQLARALADYANLKKRSDEERSTMYKLASVSFMSKLLPIIDNLKQAQNHVNDSGIAIIIGQLETLAKDEGFEEIKLKVGDLFNEELAEAVEAIETDKEMDNNTISEVILSGWKYSDGSVVRHARVQVYKYEAQNTKSETNQNI
jgi:molecular chaperone GrpE